MKAIYLKEMRSYFHSLAAYIYFALFIAATGVYFSVICMSYGYTAVSYTHLIHCLDDTFCILLNEHV